MPSTYSANLKIELQATGENAGTWGTITNTNLGTALEQAIVGSAVCVFTADADLTLTYADTNAAQIARALVLNAGSSVSLTTTRNLIVPTIQKEYVVQNSTTGSQSIMVKTLTGTGITVPNGRKAHLYVDGTNVVVMDDFVDINGGSIDGVTLGTSSALTEAQIDNINLNGNTVSSTNTNGNLLLAPNGTGAVGLGTASPAARFHAYTNTANEVARFEGLTTEPFISLFSGNARQFFIQTRSGDIRIWGDTNSKPILFGVNNSERMRLNTNGILALGHTTGATWGSGIANAKAIQLGDGYLAGSVASDAPYGVFNVVHNATWNGTNWIYTNSAAVCRYSTDRGTGNHIFENAPIGTGGTAVTLTERFRIGTSFTIVNSAFADHDFRVHSTSVADMFLVEATNSNVKIGGSAERATTIGNRHLDIFNGTAPSGTLANGISIYSSSGEAYVMDATGNATLISPHDSDTNEWIFRSKHTPTGKVLRIDVERLLRFVNDHFGLDAVKEFIEE
jgi:hypothetical protein